MPIQIVTTKNYKYGQIDNIEAPSIPRGAASSMLNWLTKADHIEIRRGQAYLGTSSVNTGNGKATGLKRATQSTGTEILFGTYGKKLKYYDETTAEWIENGSDLLGAGVVDSNGLGIEDIFMSEYTGLAGNQLFLNSPNCSGYYKIMIGNPGSSLNVYDAAKNFKGYFMIDTNRTLLWGRTADQTGLYGSYVDAQTYTTVTAEAYGTGNGVLVTFAHTAAAISSTRTIFGITVTDGVETFTDNFDGTLTGSLGGTGTVNYVTGAMSVTFNTAPGNPTAITTTYQWENSNTHGITDFTKSATRLAGEGFIFRQDEGGGALRSIGQYNQVYYCFHTKKTWVLNIGATDTSATNLPYRQKVGIPNERASVETGDGIYYIDDTDKNDVKIRLLTYGLYGSTQVIPVPISNNLNLNTYLFDQSAAIQWGDLLLFACATADSTQTVNGKTVALNNRVLVYNKLWKSWDVLDYDVTCFEVYNGTLVAGDAFSNNFITLFSGFDDFGADSIPNYWIGKIDDLDIDGLKKSKKLYIQGSIAPDQKLKISMSVDFGPFIEVGSHEGTDPDTGLARHYYAIEGTGTYVDKTQSVSIGASILGTKELGGGSNGVIVYNYEREFNLNLDKFETVQIKYEAMAVGYVSVSMQKYWDVRFKGRKIPSKYRG